MTRKSKIFKFVFLLLFILTYSINNSPSFDINKEYIVIYESWFNILSKFYLIFNFSVGDILYLITPIIIIFYYFKIKRRRDKLIYILKVPLIIYCFFYWSWGFNYNKNSEFESLKKNTYSLEDLSLTTQFYINKLNDLQVNLSQSEENKVESKLSFNDIKIKCIKTINNEDWSLINKKLNNFPVKKSLFSTPLSYMGFSGYINPFTLEANINYNIPNISLPVTITHEIAHQIGYAFEDEANFIAIKTLTKSNDKFLQYSGNLIAVQYLLSEIRKLDIKSYNYYVKQLNIGVVKNIKEKNDYYLKFENKFEDYFKKGYDIFLKNNNQKAGLKTYSLVIDLLINDYQSKI